MEEVEVANEQINDEMQVAKEFLSITEVPGENAVILLDSLGLPDDVFSGVVGASFVLAFQQLTEELQDVSGVIEISPDPSLKEAITSIKFLLVDDEFQLLTYFGGLADPTTSLHDGLLHIAEILETTRTAIFEETS